MGPGSRPCSSRRSAADDRAAAGNLIPSKLMPLVAYLQIADTVCSRRTRPDPLQVDAVAGISGGPTGRLQRPPVCSEMTRVEVLRGVRTDERRATERLVGT